MKSFFLTFFLIPAFVTFGQNSLNIMSFNVRLDVASDSQNNWQYRRDHLVSQVIFHEADLLGVQEPLENQREDLSRMLTGYKFIGVPRDTTRSGEYSAIYYDTSRLRVIEHNTFWLSETPDRPGKKGWDAALPRIVTWGKFKDERTKKVFYMFNTHFDHMGKVARRESAHLLLKKIDSIAGRFPVIVTGDFNSHPQDEPIRVILDENDPLHLTDSKSISQTPHFGPTGTFTGFKAGAEGNDPIDYIFIKNEVRILKHATFSESWKGRYSSDHFPVFAKIEL